MPRSDQKITWEETAVCNILKQANEHFKWSFKKFTSKQNKLYPALYIVYLYTMTVSYTTSLTNHLEQTGNCTV